MNQLTIEKRAAVIRCLVEGNSIRSTVRITGAAKNTVTKLLVELGTACDGAHRRLVRNVTAKRVQVDEIWCFVGAKAKNVPAEHQFDGWGDAWTWNAIDADTKLMIGWTVGGRDAGTGERFLTDVAGRLANRIQLTSDGHRAYLDAVDAAFGGDVDYAMLIKLYGPGSGKGPESRYSPAKCNGAKKEIVCGMPEREHISTSYAERANLTMRMQMRRFTRLTNAFSKKVENLKHALAVHYMHYNFCRIHQTLRITPAMAAGLSDHVWGIEELIALLSPPETRAAKIKKTVA